MNRRGRGRGGAGGRGRGGAHGRGGSAAGRRPHSQPPADEWAVEKVTDADQTLDIAGDTSAFFLGVTSFEQHLAAQTADRSRYAAAIAVLTRDGVEISQNARVRALAAAWARNDPALAAGLLKLRATFGVAEVLKAATMLDAGRKMREWEKRLAKAQSQAGGGHPAKKLASKVKCNLDNLATIRPTSGSASGAFCRHVKRWVRGFSRAELEYFALHMTREPWKKLADICHFNPAADFPEAPWFLPFCFGDEPPEGSLAKQCSAITPENVNEMLGERALPFAEIRRFLPHLTDGTKALVVRNDDRVDRGIWWYEDLRCSEVDAAIEARLRGGEKVTLTYGKLMERLLLFSGMTPEPSFLELLTPIAEQKLQTTTLNLEAPVVVIGDASSSMDVAIRTATIIGSLLSAITKSNLVFFNDTSWSPKASPRTIQDVLQLAQGTKASGCTAHASALHPIYERKEVVRTFIIVTDEEENLDYKGFRFFRLFQLYCQEVHNAALVFVSFLQQQHAKGQMVSEAERLGISVQQFVLNRSRPDLNKLDSILGRLGVRSDTYEEEVRKMTARFSSEGLHQVLDQLFASQTGIDEL